MSAIDLALPRVETAEGFEPHKYIDTEGHISIGFGFNLDAGISEYAAGALLTAQLQELQSALLKLPWYLALDEARQSVCLEIAFNAGLSGLLAFPKMIAALHAQDWASAAEECQVSNPELQSRYAALGRILLSGDA